MRKSFVSSYDAIERRLLLSTTPNPAAIVTPPPPLDASQVTTLAPPPSDGVLTFLAASDAPVVLVIPTGTGQVYHFLTTVSTTLPYSDFPVLSYQSAPPISPLS